MKNLELSAVSVLTLGSDFFKPTLKGTKSNSCVWLCGMVKILKCEINYTFCLVLLLKKPQISPSDNVNFFSAAFLDNMLSALNTK